MNLYDLKESVQFYEDRYSKGYMDEWDLAKKQRVKEIIQGLNLPDTGEALDFGCGTGVFTAILKEALPRWHIYGTDISVEAIAKAVARHSDCTFFVVFDERFNNIKLDFIFTHHVLEHVYNINKVLKEIGMFMKPVSSCLHIVPCGNEGSLEYKLCKLTKNGINANYGGRFFFEAEGHIRRLATEQLSAFLEPYGFKLYQEYYANQFYGGINWIITTREHILKLSDYRNAINLKAKILLLWLRIWLLSFYFLIQPANYVKKFKEKKYIGLKQLIFFTISLLLYPVSILFYNYIKIKSNREWGMKKTHRNGSEMYLYYKRFN